MRLVIRQPRALASMTWARSKKSGSTRSEARSQRHRVLQPARSIGSNRNAAPDQSLRPGAISLCPVTASSGYMCAQRAESHQRALRTAHQLEWQAYRTLRVQCQWKSRYSVPALANRRPRRAMRVNVLVRNWISSPSRRIKKMGRDAQMVDRCVIKDAQPDSACW